MSSIALGPRAKGPGVGDRPSRGGAGPAAVPAPRERTRAGPAKESRRREGAAEFARILAATVAFHAVLIALPFLAPVPFALMGVFLGIIATPFGAS